MAKISKSAKMKKGSIFGEEQWIELARTFYEKTGCIEPILDNKGQHTGAYKVLEEFKMVLEIDTKDIRSNVPERIDKYLDFKENTLVKSVTTRVKTDPADDENITPPIVDEEDDDAPYYVGQLLIDPKKSNEVETVNPPLKIRKKGKK